MWNAQLSNKWSRMRATCDLVLFHLDTTFSSARIFLLSYFEWDNFFEKVQL